MTHTPTRVKTQTCSVGAGLGVQGADPVTEDVVCVRVCVCTRRCGCS